MTEFVTEFVEQPCAVSAPICIEVALPDDVFRTLQAILDKQPTQTLDGLVLQAIYSYLALLGLQSPQEGDLPQLLDLLADYCAEPDRVAVSVGR